MLVLVAPKNDNCVEAHSLGMAAMGVSSIEINCSDDDPNANARNEGGKEVTEVAPMRYKFEVEDGNGAPAREKVGTRSRVMTAKAGGHALTVTREPPVMVRK